MLKKLTLVACGFLAGVLLLTTGVEAWAHTGSPTPTTWSSGNTLTAANLNDTISHIHNTFTAGIVDAHISSSAAIAHSKLATPALVPKAWAVVTTNCNGGAAAWTPCGAFTGSKVTQIAESGTNGTFCVQLAYTPTDTNFAVIVSTNSANRTCESDNRSSGATCGGITPTNRHFLINCYDAALALANADQFSFVVLDDN